MSECHSRDLFALFFSYVTGLRSIPNHPRYNEAMEKQRAKSRGEAKEGEKVIVLEAEQTDKLAKEMSIEATVDAEKYNWTAAVDFSSFRILESLTHLPSFEILDFYNQILTFLWMPGLRAKAQCCS